MKKQFLILVAIAVFATALTTTASGQTGRTIRVDVNFDFQIGDRTFPAGEYRIEPISSQTNNILQISSMADASIRQFIVANHSANAKTQAAKLVFQKFGENYFLRSIVLESEQWGYSIRASRRQRESENRRLAAAGLR